jgi:hypothetical protein
MDTTEAVAIPADFSPKTKTKVSWGIAIFGIAATAAATIVAAVVTAQITTAAIDASK